MNIPEEVNEFLRRALHEDIRTGDITTESIIPQDKRSKAIIRTKSDIVLAGLPFAEEVMRILDPQIDIRRFFNDGNRVKNGETIAHISGNTHALLKGERVALNILQRLSGIATLTSRFADSVRDKNVKIVDTRKTTPCMRYLEKYAVRMGGGFNHRFGLYDGVLIKDNHIKVCGGLKEAIRKAKDNLPHHLLRIEVEVKDIDELKLAIEEGADIIMLDNMKIDEIREAVKMVRKSGKKIILEVSGNVNLENIRSIAETGVDLISVGMLTHSAPAADISMKIID